MRALKFLVIAMGVVLVLGFAVIAIEVVRRASVDRPAPEAADAVPAAAVPAGAPYAARIDLPAGARIGAVVATDAQVVVQVIMPQGGAILHAFDPATGALAGTVRIMGPE